MILPIPERYQVPAVAILKGTNGNNVLITEIGRKKNMQKMGAVHTHLPPWLAQETSILELLQTWKKGTRQMMHPPDSQTDTRQDIMMVRLTIDAL